MLAHPDAQDAALAQYAALTEALLASGARLRVIGMVRRLEAGTAMEPTWPRSDKASGRTRATRQRPVRAGRSPGFQLVVGQTGEDVAAGFGHARSIYTSRAENRMQAFLHCFLQ